MNRLQSGSKSVARCCLNTFLDGWVTDEPLWPPKLSLKPFREWFDIQYHSMLWDLAELPLEVEDWDEDEDGEVTIH